MSSSQPLIASTLASDYVAETLAPLVDGRLIPVERRQFPDGERYLRLQLEAQADAVGRDAFIVGSTASDADLLELYRLGCALADLGARQRVFFIPFLGYSTMERARHPGEVVTAKHNARLLSSIPSPGLGNVFIFLDLHEPQLLHYMGDTAVALEVSAIDQLAEAVRARSLGGLVVGSADLGMSRGVKRMAELLHAEVALVSKSRAFDHTQVTACVGDVKDKTVVIYDDMVRSGSSLINAAQAYHDQGAQAIYAVTSHLALTQEHVVSDLRNSFIEHIITTNSHPMSQHPAVATADFFTILDIAPLLASIPKHMSAILDTFPAQA